MTTDLKQSLRCRTPLPAEGRCFFVSRHLGAIEWAKRFPWAERAQFVSHLEMAQVVPGDTVIGTLPVQLAAEVCARGAFYRHLSISLLAEQRGQELSADDMEAAGACLVPCQVLLEAVS
jgi:CRISPR-associated protein Csx16